MRANHQSRLPFAACWIVLCAFLHCAGWLLSAVHQLNLTGYALLFALGGAAFFLWQRKQGASFFRQVNFRKQLRRFRRSFPLAFLILATLAILGGVIHAPANFDALTCRIPRVFHWLWEQRWHWIHTEFSQLFNTRVCGIEWVSAPLMALTKSYRLVFLPNVVSFLLLPSLIFSVFTRLGVLGRVAWNWMWLLPAGYCFLLQAGSAANDLFSAPFALAAVDFGLRAKDSRRFRDAALAMLSTALLTSTKYSNLPLLLPCAIALLPSWRLIMRRPIALCAVLFVAALCSFLPTAALNVKYCGDWTGAAAETVDQNVFRGHRPVRLVYSSAVTVIYNLAPPVFPFANAFNEASEKLIPPAVAAAMRACYGQARFHFQEIQSEEGAGLGFGVSLLVLGALGAKIFWKAKPTEGAHGRGERTFRAALKVSPYVGLAVFMANGLWTSPLRYLTPYYPLLLPLLLAGREQAELVRKSSWKITAGFVFVLAALPLILSPARPLWPAEWLFNKASVKNSTNPLLIRAARVYSIYGRRSDAMAPVRSLIPAEAKVLGLIMWDDPEASLWMPWGARQIEHLSRSDTADDLRRKGIQYVLAKSLCFDWPYKMPLAEWLAQHDGEVVHVIPLDLKASGSKVDWLLIKLRPADRSN